MGSRAAWDDPAERRRLSVLLGHAADMVAVLDGDGRILFRTSQGVLGYSDGALAGQSAFDLVHPEDQEIAARLLARVLRRERPAPAELRARAADGSWRWVEVVISNHLDDPDVGGIVVNARDVTDRKRVQAATQGDAWFRSLVQNGTDIVVVCDARGQARYATPSLERALGYGLGELSPAFRTDLIHPEDLEELIDAFERAREGPGLPARLEFRAKHLDGSWRTLAATVTNLLHDPHVAGIVLNLHDISELKEAEAALRSSERRWRALFENSSDVVTVFDADGSIVFSSGHAEVLGYDATIGPDPAWMFDLVHPDDRDLALREFARMFAGSGIIGPNAIRVRHADGSWRWVETMANRLLDDPAIGGTVVHTRDITDRKEAELRLRAQNLFVQTLHQIGQALFAELDLVKLVQAITDAATDLSGATHGAFFPAHTHDGESGASALSDAVAPFLTEPPPELVVRALGAEGPLRGEHELAVPVRARSGEVLGVIYCREGDDAFTDATEQLVAGIAAHAAVALDNARLHHATQTELVARKEAEARLAFAATHDPLTGLPNRALFVDRLSMALGRSERQRNATGVLLFDLDRFKVVNDSLGHAAGDELLVAVAERLSQIVRPGDTVARLGGDEFVMVCENLNGEIDAIGIADRVAEVLTEPFALRMAEAEVSVTASVGIAVALGPGRDPDALVRDADAAMYRAKERGRNRWELFDEVLRTKAVQRLSIETSLRRAIERGELCVRYQPIMSTATGSLAGLEALLRWDHPEQGLVAPGQFIRVAEETGLIVPIGMSVLREAALMVTDEAVTAHRGALTVTVNLSARQLSQRDLVRAIVQILDETGADPSRLGLEITESVIMEDVDVGIAVLGALRDLGLRLWVDDFGTGYSSLAYLRRLPLDGLKIDRSFVAGLGKEAEDSAIVAGIVSLAHTLGLSAVAEGVETAEQMLLLRELGCDFAQGHHWSPAVTVDELVDPLRG